MKYPLIICAALVSTICFAQKQNVYFLKFDGATVNTRDSADFIRLVREPDSGKVNYPILEYYK